MWHRMTTTLRGLLQRRRAAREIDEELQFHVEMQVRANLARGISPNEARRHALVALGGMTQTKEAVRDVRGIAFFDHLAQDVRYAVRRLNRERPFAAAAILTIALAVGLNTAIFSVTNAALLRPLPYDAPDRLVLVGKGEPNDPLPWGLSEPEYYDWFERQHVFSGMATEALWYCDFIGPGFVSRLNAARISASLLPLLGVRPILGRGFLPEEEQPGRDKVVLLSEGVWRDLFGSDPQILGKRIRLSEFGKADLFEVVGVTPRSFRFRYRATAGAFTVGPPKGVDVFRPVVPLGVRHSEGARRTAHYNVYARLRPGVTLEQARAACYDLHERLKREHPMSIQRAVGKVVPLHEATFGSTRPAILMLTGAVALVLLMGCTNVAGLLLARGAAREQEMSIRTALGGGRRRLFQQLLTENLVTATAGGAAGLVLAFWATWLLAGLVPADLSRGREIGIDWTVLAFTVAISLVTGLLVGVVPAWRAARADVIGVLKVGAGASGGSGRRLRGLLVAAQVGVVLVLLAAGGLMLNSVWRMARTDLGFDTTHVATVFIRLNNEACGPERREPFRTELLWRVRRLPGIVVASTTSDLPFSTGGMVGFRIPGTPRGNFAEFYVVDHDYLSLMRYPLKRGRLLAESDRKGGFVAVVNDAFVDQYFPGVNPLGQRIVVKDTYEIVGVVGNHREMISRSPLAGGVRNLSNEATSGPTFKAMALPAIYIPSAQADFSWCVLYLVARTGPDPRALVTAIRNQVAAVNPNQAVTEVATLDQWAAAPATSTRFYAVALAVFALVAGMLAAVGIYGVLAQAVERRVREIGVRIALGASRARVEWLVTSQILVLVGVGVAAGLAGALAVTRALESFLFDLTPTDPPTYVLVVIVLVLVAAGAAYLPARRAARIEPMTALRWE